ncbi:four helix bundle protein [Candidatus Gottesmanbacteria bacterium]|nr:four helix bundle protein [Candidatus Gottesmanbacteria bacterium]
MRTKENSNPGYKYLTTYILATVIYDLTVKFCAHFIASYRQKEQMTQAARSDKSNIAEGYTFQSTEGYLKLLGTACGSAQELVEDFEDFLRQRKLQIWSKDDPRVRNFRMFRAVWVSPNFPNTPNLPNSPEEAANLLLTFCQMQTFLLKRQMEGLRKKFILEGGFREKLFRERRNNLL